MSKLLDLLDTLKLLFIALGSCFLYALPYVGIAYMFSGLVFGNHWSWVWTGFMWFVLGAIFFLYGLYQAHLDAKASADNQLAAQVIGSSSSAQYLSFIRLVRYALLYLTIRQRGLLTDQVLAQLDQSIDPNEVNSVLGYFAKDP